MGDRIMGLTLVNTTGAISSGTADVEITGLSDAYKAYEFHFYNIICPSVLVKTSRTMRQTPALW